MCFMEVKEGSNARTSSSDSRFGLYGGVAFFCSNVSQWMLRKKGCALSSAKFSKPSLDFGSHINNYKIDGTYCSPDYYTRLIRSTDADDMSCGKSIGAAPTMFPYITAEDSAQYGGVPVSISNSIVPKLHRSTAKPYG